MIEQLNFLNLYQFHNFNTILQIKNIEFESIINQYHYKKLKPGTIKINSGNSYESIVDETEIFDEDIKMNPFNKRNLDEITENKKNYYEHRKNNN